MSLNRTVMNNWVAAWSWLLAFLFGIFGLYCWVFDPFFEPGMNVHMGSMVSYVGGAASVAMCAALGIAGLTRTPRIIFLLGLANVALFVTVAVAMVAGKVKVPPGTVLLAVSAVISVAMFLLWRWCRGNPSSGHKLQSPATSPPNAENPCDGKI